LALLFDQWVKFTLVIIQNSLFFLGDYILNGMIEPVMSEWLNSYQVPLHLDDFFKGQRAHADVFLDLRHVTNKNPVIGPGYLDVWTLGEVVWNSEDCGDIIVDNNIHFYDILDESQFVIGESAFTCAMF